MFREYILELNGVLKKELQRHGMVGETASIGHVSDLKAEIASLRDQSLLDEQFFNENLRWLDFDYRNAMPDAKTILVIAVPQLMTLLNFQYNESEYSVPIPPTYVFSNTSAAVEKLLLQVLSPYGYNIKRTALPAKLLAVRTGLGIYGRNNICYVNGMGSFHRIVSYYSDMPLCEDSWQEKKVMPECGKCRACIRACPTKCIDNERFLIYAERCITNLNEKERDFPGWLDKSWHNAVVGCMKCQAACPKNKDFIGKAADEIAFTQEETSLILGKTPLSQLPDVLKQKLENLDMIEYYDVLHRNLSVLVG